MDKRRKKAGRRGVCLFFCLSVFFMVMGAIKSPLTWNIIGIFLE